MKQNMGPVDRVARAIIALVLLALSLTSTITGLISTIAIVLAVVLILTAAVGFCPLYLPFKFTTRKV